MWDIEGESVRYLCRLAVLIHLDERYQCTMSPELQISLPGSEKNAISAFAVVVQVSLTTVTGD